MSLFKFYKISNKKKSYHRLFFPKNHFFKKIKSKISKSLLWPKNEIKCIWQVCFLLYVVFELTVIHKTSINSNFNFNN